MDYILGTTVYNTRYNAYGYYDKTYGYYEIIRYHDADQYVVLEDTHSPNDCNTAFSFWLGAEAGKE